MSLHSFICTIYLSFYHKIPCQLTVRQRKLYNGIKEKISLNDLLENSSTEQGLGHLMNLVMQFRKVYTSFLSLLLAPFLPTYLSINSLL
jgi:hypothetical protein